MLRRKRKYNKSDLFSTLRIILALNSTTGAVAVLTEDYHLPTVSHRSLKKLYKTLQRAVIFKLCQKYLITFQVLIVIITEINSKIKPD